MHNMNQVLNNDDGRITDGWGWLGVVVLSVIWLTCALYLDTGFLLDDFTHLNALRDGCAGRDYAFALSSVCDGWFFWP